jgi:hypothetical protein
VRQYNAGMLRLVETDEPPLDVKSAGQVLDEVVAVLADGIRCVSPADPAAGHLRDLHDLLAARRRGAAWR